MAMGYDDGVIEFMMVDNYMVDHTEQAHTAEISDMDFSKDGLMLVTCGHDRVVLVYEIEYYSNSPRSVLIWKEQAGKLKEVKIKHKFDQLWPRVEQILHGVIFNGQGQLDARIHSISLCLPAAAPAVLDLILQFHAPILKS